MASQPYQEIVQRLESIEPQEIWLLLGEIQSRIKSQPKRSLNDFRPTGPGSPSREEWVAKQRQEWDNEG